jgi:hypothetical protein
MDDTLKNLKKISLPDKIILIPHFVDQDLFTKETRGAVKKINLLGGEIYLFDSYCIITRFIGYPCLLTILGFIHKVREKMIYFIGTGGCLGEGRKDSELLTVKRIYSSSILDHLAEQREYGLIPVKKDGVKMINAVTVDIIQRETGSWMAQQIKKGIYCVEMELFPLRWYLKKKFTALLITTDEVTVNGILPYPERKGIRGNFKNAFMLVKELCGHEE